MLSAAGYANVRGGAVPSSGGDELDHRWGGPHLGASSGAEGRLQDVQLDQSVDGIDSALSGKRVPLGHLSATDVWEPDQVSRKSFCSPSLSSLMNPIAELMLQGDEPFNLALGLRCN